MKRFLIALVASMFLAPAAYAAEGKSGKANGEPMKTEGTKTDAKTTKAKDGKKAEGKAKTEASKTDSKAKETK